jgi:uncharacterized protein YciI
VASIFIASLTYTAPIDRIDAVLAEHLAWLDAGHQAGYFIAWGPREPRDGGLIFVKAESRDEAERLLATDPFLLEGLADLAVIQWTPRFAFPGLEAFNG